MYITKASWEITSICNAKCIHCYAEGSKKSPQLSERNIDYLLKNLYDSGVEDISLTGGEPTLSPKFSYIVEKANLVGLNVTVLSNGIPLKKEHYDIFNNKQAFASLSFHSGNRESFKKFYNVSDKDYDNFLNSLNQIDKYSLSTCLMKENVDSTCDMLDLITSRKDNVVLWSVYNLRKSGFGFNVTELDYKEKNKIGKWLEYECLIRDVNLINALDDTDKNNCALVRPQSSVFINPQGQIRPCYALPDFSSNENLFEKELNELLEDKVFTRWYNPEYNFDNRCKSQLLLEGYSLDYVTKSGGKEAFLNSKISFSNIKIRDFDKEFRIYNPINQRAFVIEKEQKDLLDFDGKKVKDYLSHLKSKDYNLDEDAIKNLFDFISVLRDADILFLEQGGKNENIGKNNKKL